MIPFRNIFFLLATALFLMLSHNKKDSSLFGAEPVANQPRMTHTFEDTVTIGDFFKVMEGIVNRYDALLNHPISEHLIIRHNPWVIDSLAASDYYRLKDRGIISLDSKKIPIFKPGQSLVIPDSAAVDSLNRVFGQTRLDLNIPEFKLRVFQRDSLVHEFLVRVGRNERKYLAMAGRVEDLRTKTGAGKIVQHVKDPDFINPVNNKAYHVTHRDDDVVTALPNIPWLVPEINGVLHGQLIHPTTNLETLGKAYSNGCIGTSEAAAWYLYYYAPVGTRIAIRYDLEIVDEEGNIKRLPNIYHR